MLAPKSRYEHGRDGSDGRARARGDAVSFSSR